MNDPRLYRTTRLAACLLTLLPALPATAADGAAACRAIDDDASRLACYDRAAGRAATAPAPSSAPGSAATAPAANSSVPAGSGLTATATPAAAPRPSGLTKAWDLDPAGKHGTFTLLPYKANYVLPVRTTSSANVLPNSPNPANQLSTPLPVQATEAKFQISVKLKAWENLFGDNGDLWFGYTQQSNWQLYNSAVSRPFRETDYAPEVLLAFRTNVEWGGWRWRLFNVGLEHQSNGRADPLSRSWNRVYALFGVEHDNLTLTWQPWWRLKESPANDNNPDIEDYLGWSELRLIYARGGNVYSALGRYSFTDHRGGLQLEWGFPLTGALKGYLQLTTGYGESLIDYNHSQTTIGVGLLLVPW